MFISIKDQLKQWNHLTSTQRSSLINYKTKQDFLLLL